MGKCFFWSVQEECIGDRWCRLQPTWLFSSMYLWIIYRLYRRKKINNIFLKHILYKSILLYKSIRQLKYQISRLPVLQFFCPKPVGLVSVCTYQIQWQNSHIHVYYKSIISTFMVLQRTTQGQTKILYKKHLFVLVILIHGYGVYCKHLRT